MKSYRRFKNIARILEVLVSGMLFSWLISRSFPYFSAIFELSCLFLNRFSTLLLNHHFIFLLGNAIIATLFLKFGGEKQSTGDVVDEYVIDEIAVPPIANILCEIPPLETVSGEKRIIPAEVEAVPVARRHPEPEKCRKSPSYEFEQARREPHRELENPYKEMAVNVDDLSNEEFQRRVEAFIARQQKFLIDESLAILST